MNRIVLAATAIFAGAVPAAAQYRDYYRDYYEDRGYDGWYERGRDPYGRRGYDPYDNDWRREPRRSERRYDDRQSGRGGLGDVCVTAGGTCPHPPVPVGTGCGCATSRGTFNGSVR